MKVIKKFYMKYQSLSLVAKASVWFVICGILQRSVALLTTPIFTRMLTTVEYGEFTVYNSWLNIFSIITTLRLDYGVFNKGMSKFPEERDQYTSSMQGATNIVTFVVFLFYIILNNQINELTELNTFITMLMFLELFFMPAIRFWTLRQRYEYRYKAVVIVTLLITIANSMCGVLAILLTHRDKGVARIISCIVVETCFGIVLYFVNLSRGKQIFNWKYVKFAVIFNIPLLPYYFSGYILSQADRIMIQKMVGLEATAIYGVAYNIGLMMTIVSNSVNSALTPWEYEMLRQNKPKRITEKFYVIMVLVFFALCAFMAVAPEVIYILGGKKYFGAVIIIPAVTSSILFMLMSDIFTNIEFYFEETKRIAAASIGAAVVNMVLNYLLLPVFGYLIAGYVVLASYLIFAVIHYFMCKKICIKNNCPTNLVNVKVVLLIFAVFALLAILLTFGYEMPLIKYVFILIIGVIIYCKREYLYIIYKGIE